MNQEPIGWMLSYFRGISPSYCMIKFTWKRIINLQLSLKGD